eukprot:gene6519-7190_t
MTSIDALLSDNDIEEIISIFPTPAALSSLINESTIPIIPSHFLIKHKTAVFWHPACALHDIPDHPEQPDRVNKTIQALRQSTLLQDVSFREASLAPMETTRLFHSEKMIKAFKTLWKETEETYYRKKEIISESLDGGDTKVMFTTREAVLRAVGAVTNAVDAIYSPTISPTNRVDTAFCCIRPPGHHAEPDRAFGFCFFNNIGIGVKYLQSKYSVKKVAVLDFDVHHGNGTEEGFLEDVSVFYGSTHEKGAFPGTGWDPSPKVGEHALHERDRRIVNRHLHSGPNSRNEFYVKWKEILLEMERFQPQAIFISAGFDAHDDDPLSDIELVDEDFRWITRQILVTALRLSIISGNRVPVISALEGGYDIDAISRSAIAHVNALQEGFAGVADLFYQEEAQRQEMERQKLEKAGDEAAALRESIEAMGLLQQVEGIEDLKLGGVEKTSL